MGYLRSGKRSAKPLAAFSSLRVLLQLDGFSSALDMESISWDAELEAIAQVWADQCAYGHDDCRDVQRFKVTGSENLHFDITIT